MKHLKLFETVQDKETWKNSDNYVTPNVNYVNENNVIEYNSNMQLLSLQTFTPYPEVANKIMTIVNKYCSNYENVANMTILIDMNFNYDGINYGPGDANATIYSDANFVDFKVSTEELNYLQSINIVDTIGNVYKPHDINISISTEDIIFKIYEDNTNPSSNVIRKFIMSSIDGYINDPKYQDPNAPEPV